ncbi:MAG: hypothetical protein BWY31_04737 [Lentisphaerae bacterium ADurb.Bin242]|nr:MAG: hypothetical protein BWY31_04737 [Lentisphaerae bacterium ADurb.Bin242]
MEKSTCLSVEHPASRSVSQENAPDSREYPGLPLTLSGWLTKVKSNGSCGKMFRAASARTEGEISEPFYPDFPGSRLPPPETDGEQPDLFATIGATASAWHGECWTLNLPEFPAFRSPSPSADGVCSLSDVLVTGNVPPQYYLSRTACLGILRRAEKRGKSLPEMLEKALKAQADSVVVNSVNLSETEQREL